jgi:hypothetical protein
VFHLTGSVIALLASGCVVVDLSIEDGAGPQPTEVSQPSSISPGPIEPTVRVASTVLPIRPNRAPSRATVGTCRAVVLPSLSSVANKAWSVVPFGSEADFAMAVRNVGDGICVFSGRPDDVNVTACRDTEPHSVECGDQPTDRFDVRTDFVVRTLSPGDSALLPLHFRAPARGPAPGNSLDAFSIRLGVRLRDGAGRELLAVGNADGRPDLTVVATGGQLAAVPRTLDFGPVRIGCGPVTRRLNVANPSLVPVTVSALWVSHDCPAVTLVDQPELPLTLLPGQSLDVLLGYDARDEGAQACAVTVVTDAVHHPDFRVPVRGHGTHAATLVQTVTWSERADILVVRDDSPSMATWASAADVALAELDGARVTTTAAAWHLGTTVPNPGLDGPIHEQTLAAAWYAAVHPGAMDPMGAADPLEPDAALHVVIVTDEVDSSPNATVWIQLLHHVRGAGAVAAGRLQIHTLTPCDEQGEATTAGGVIDSVRQATGGYQIGLCEPADTLAQAIEAEVDASPRRSLTLAGIPDDFAAAALRIDGKKCSSGWTWDPLHNMAWSSDACLPATDAQVEISYPAACPAQ